MVLDFPAGVTQTTCINDIPNLTVQSVSFGAQFYVIVGNSIALTGGITTDSGPPLEISLSLPMELAGSQTFSIGTDRTLSLYGVLSGTGDLTVAGTGTIRLDAANTFAGALLQTGGTVQVTDASGLGSPSGVTSINNATMVIDNGSSTVGLNIAEPFVLTQAALVNQRGHNILSGSIILNGQATLSSGAPSSAVSLIVAGLVTGSGDARFNGGTITLTNDNTYTGPTFVLGASLRVNGSQPGSDVTSFAGAVSGTGHIGDLTCGGGSIGSVSPELLSTGDLTLSSACTLRGTVRTSAHTQIDAVGIVTLGGTFAVSGDSGLKKGQIFVIVSNDGTDPVNGTFQELPEGATVGNIFTISYVGGTGNDVTLTVLPVPVELMSFTIE